MKLYEDENENVSGDSKGTFAVLVKRVNRAMDMNMHCASPWKTPIPTLTMCTLEPKDVKTYMCTAWVELYEIQGKDLKRKDYAGNIALSYNFV